MIIPPANRDASLELDSPLRARVRSSQPEANMLLDQILSGIQVSENWEAAIKKVIDNPEIELVTLEGDYFNGASWHVGPLISGATGSALDESIRKIRRTAQ